MAASTTNEAARAEALRQLTWAREPEAAALARAALESSDEGTQAVAAMALAELGSGAAEQARERLFERLKAAGPDVQATLAWTLVVIGDVRAVDQLAKSGRAGALARVQRLDGSAAFEPSQFARTLSPEVLDRLARDRDPELRALAAVALAHRAEASAQDGLIRLVNDSLIAVARNAAPGLALHADPKAQAALIARMKKLTPQDYALFLDTLAEQGGTAALLVTIPSAGTVQSERGWRAHAEIFNRIHDPRVGGTGSNDPRAGDALYAFAQSQTHPHWRWRAAAALAAIGDLRAVPLFAARLRVDPLKIYSSTRPWEAELQRDDTERVVAARMLADLAAIHPQARARIARESEDGLLAWLQDTVAPHANGMRALAAMQSSKLLPLLRQWANPTEPLPQPEAPPPMREEFVIAQSALRYLGAMRDAESWSVLEGALNRRKKDYPDIDVTMEGIMQGSVALLGMSLRALNVGASDGFSEWGDAKAFPALLELVMDERNNEAAQMSACTALAWVAAPRDVPEITKRIRQSAGAAQSRRACLLEALLQRSGRTSASDLLSLLTAETSPQLRLQVARAVARAGLNPSVEATLFEAMKNDALRLAAALALVLGGSPATAGRAVALYGEFAKADMGALNDAWFRSFGYWSTEDVERGLLYRNAANAEAIDHVLVSGKRQDWARKALRGQFETLVYDNGPHSLTRVVLRQLLWQSARSGSPAQRRDVLRTLELMKERGVLLALAE